VQGTITVLRAPIVYKMDRVLMGSKARLPAYRTMVISVIFFLVLIILVVIMKQTYRGYEIGKAVQNEVT
jgi:preprotein translocase subunit SecG